MQEKYRDAIFVLLDGEPNDGNWESGSPKYETGSNTICYLFAEEQVGFLVGVAGAVELRSGELGFIGGMSVPAVQRFSWGFQQGIGIPEENPNLSADTISKVDEVFRGLREGSIRVRDTGEGLIK